VDSCNVAEDGFIDTLKVLLWRRKKKRENKDGLAQESLEFITFSPELVKLIRMSENIRLALVVPCGCCP